MSGPGSPQDRLVPLKDLPALDQLIRDKVQILHQPDKGVSWPINKVLCEIAEKDALEEWEFYSTHEFANMMLNDDPPTATSIRSLPDALEFSQEFLEQCFVVYNGLWEQDSRVPRAYTGSATSFDAGAWVRIRTAYGTGSGSEARARFCRKSEEEGFELTHVGIAIVAIRRARQAWLRGWMISVEAATTYHLGTMYGRPGALMRQLCRWDVEKLGYTGLCSHNPMYESIKGLEMTDADIEAMIRARATRSNLARNRTIEQDSIVLEAKELGEINSSDSEYQTSKSRETSRQANIKRQAGKHSENRRRVREGEASKSDPEVLKTVLYDQKRAPTSGVRRNEARQLKRKRDAGEVVISDTKVLKRIEKLESDSVNFKTGYAADTALIKRYDQEPEKLTDAQVRQAKDLKAARKAKQERETAIYDADTALIKQWKSDPGKLSDAQVQRAKKMQAGRQKKIDAITAKRQAKKAGQGKSVKSNKLAEGLGLDSDVGSSKESNKESNKENEFNGGNEAEDEESDYEY